MKKKFARLLEETYAEWSSPSEVEVPHVVLKQEPIPLLYPPSVQAPTVQAPTLEEALTAVVEAEAAAQPWLERLAAAKRSLSVALAAYDTSIAEMKARADAVRALLEN